MFDEFRKSVKGILKQQHISYAKLSEVINVSERTVARFMCGATNNRQTAEKIADALGLLMQYNNGKYKIVACTKQFNNKQIESWNTLKALKDKDTRESFLLLALRIALLEIVNKINTFDGAIEELNALLLVSK